MRGFLRKIRRRKVLPVATGYAIVAWLLIQVGAIVLPVYGAPDWVLKAFITLLVLGFPIALVLAWAYDVEPSGVVRTGSDSDNGTDRAEDALALPPGPTIAVLPFQNLSPDPGQNLFAQAITNDIVAGLTQSSTLFVVETGDGIGASRPEGNLQTMGKELGVRYLLHGSVNRSGDALRVTAHLADTANNVKLWSANYDEALTAENLFDVQDDIREQIVATLGDFHGVIYTSETVRNVHRPTDNLNAYECLSVALAYDKYLSREYHLRARESLERAVELDPEYDSAWAHLSWIYTDEHVFGYNPLPNPMERARDAAMRGVELAPTNYHNHWLLSRVHYFNGQRDAFFAEAEKALDLNANDGTTLGLIGCYTAVAGEWERGVALIEKARLLNPKHPDYYYWFMAAARIQAEEFEGALRELRKMTITGWPMGLMFLSAMSALTGEDADAARYLRDLTALDTSFELEKAREDLSKMLPFQPELVETIVDGLARADQP